MSYLNRNKVVGWLIAIVVVFSFVIFAPFANGEPTAKTGQTDVVTKVEKKVKPCHTVAAKKYNAYLRLRGEITGNNKTYKKLLKSKPVCVRPYYKNLKKSIKKQRKKCIKRSILTGASYYGYGDNYPANSAAGAYGTLTNNSFAELGMGNAMGGLPPNSWWYVSHVGSGFAVRGEKRDIGAGGGPIAGLPRGIDLYEPFLNALGMNDNGAVRVSKTNCWSKLKYKK